MCDREANANKWFGVNLYVSGREDVRSDWDLCLEPVEGVLVTVGRSSVGRVRSRAAAGPARPGLGGHDGPVLAELGRHGKKRNEQTEIRATIAVSLC